MTFDSLTHVLSWLVGLALLVFFGVLLFYEVHSATSHTVHVAIFSGGIGVGLIIMGFARAIADGIGAIGEKVGPYLPWKRGGP